MATSLFPAFRTTDSAATIRLLAALGFTEKLVVRDEADPDLVHHAQFDWNDRGGLMFGSVRGDDSPLDRTGGMSLYLVVASDAEVDRLFGVISELGPRVVSAVVREPEDQPHGGREFDFHDHDGNSWGIGSYRGE